MKVPVTVLALLVLLFQAAVSRPAAGEEAPPDEVKKSEAKDSEEKKSEEKHEETVVVTASRAEEELLSAPAAVTVVTAKEIERSPARNFGDLLRRVPGMNVVQFSSRDVNMLSRTPAGSLAAEELVAVDGRSVYLDFFGFVMWDMVAVQPEEISQIEVVRGPGSAVWGANALNGVVNVRTRSPREMDGLDLVRLEAGEKETIDGVFLTARAGDRVSWKVSGGWRQQGEAWPRPDVVEDTGQPLPPVARRAFQNPRLDFRVDIDRVKGGELSFSAGGARTSGVIYTGIGPFDIDDTTSLSHFQARWSRNRSEVLFFTNALDGQATNLLDGLEMSFETLTTDLSYRTSSLAGERHRLVWGGNARRLGFDISIAPDESLRVEGGAFLQDSWQLTNRWTWVIGSRVDWFDTIGTVFSPRTAFIFRPDPEQSLRLSWNRAYKAPSLIQNYLRTDSTETVELAPGLFYTFPYSARGNRDLDESRISAAELGYTRRFGDRVTVTTSVYRNETKDVQDFAPVEFYSREHPPPGWPLPPEAVPPGTFPKTFSYQNVNGVVQWGAEIGLDVNADPWTVYWSYGWQDRPDVSGGYDASIVAIPPRSRSSLGINYDAHRWGAGVTVDYIGRAFWNDVLDSRYWGWTDQKTLIGGQLVFRSRNGALEWSVSGTNLTNDDSPQHVFGDRIGRVVRTGLKYTF